MKSLVLIAANTLKEVELRYRLHALGDHLEPQAMGERDDRLHDRGIVGARSDFVDEAAIDLEPVDRQSAQVTHAGVTRAKIIDRDQYAHLTQSLERLDGFFRVAHDRRFGNLHFQ